MNSGNGKTMYRLYPDDRRGSESAPPPDWTIFNPTDRPAPSGVIADLEDLAGWSAEVTGCDGVAFGLTPALPLWGSVTTFIDVPASREPVTVILRPPAPLAVPQDADRVEIWVTGDLFDWQGKPPYFSLDLLLIDEEQREHIVQIDAHIAWNTYAARYVRLPEGLQHNAFVVGIRLAGHDPERAHRFGLDRLCMARETLHPLRLAWRPKRPLNLPPEQNVGLHRGPGKLSFPTRETTILPDNGDHRFRARIECDGSVARFIYGGNDLELEYRWAPAEHPFGVDIVLDGRPLGRALAGAKLFGPDALDWFAPSDWPGPLAREPLSDANLSAIPDTLVWGHQTLHPFMSDAHSPSWHCDPAAHGAHAVMHAFRCIDSERDQTVELGFGADWGLGLWLNGDCLADRLDGCGCVVPGSVKVQAPLRRGRNLLVCRLIEKLRLNVLNVSPLPEGTRWDGPWRLFGPAINRSCPAPVAAPLVFESLQADQDQERVTAVFSSDGLGPVRIGLQLWAKSLVMDVTAASGQAGLLDWGALTELEQPAVFDVPPMQDHALLRVQCGQRKVFVSQLFDWYRSNASKPLPLTGADSRGARLLGQMAYLPKTDGVRNPMCERLFLTCSPVYEETLPSIPNPPSPWVRETGRYVFRESWGPAHLDTTLEGVRRWVAYGMSRILHLHHECGWQYVDPEQGCINDGCTLRLDVAPHKGGNRAMREFLETEQALGLRAGLYTNYTDFYTLNSRFSADGPIRLPDGSLQRAWVHSYAMKPSLAVQYDAELTPQIARRFRPDAAYTDVHTCIAPWNRVDYDARVPGAATFAATYYAFGELLWNDQRHYAGPVISEGFYHWMYAGLVSGNYGQLNHFGRVGHDPLGALDPAFNLLKIHPLETDVGLGVTPDHFLTCRGTDEAALDAGTDRYLCACLAYGHIAYLPDDKYGIRRMLRVYHMARAFSERAAGARVTAIHARHADGHWMDLSEIHAAPLAPDCRLRIVYEGGETLFLNWGWDTDWLIADSTGRPVTLPPNGWLFEHHGEWLSASTRDDDGVRRDRAQTSEGWFVDGRGGETVFGPVAAAGAAALLIDPARPETIILIDGGGNTRFEVPAELAGSCYRAIAPDNTTLSEPVFTRRGESYAVLRAVPGAARYEWRYG